MEFADFPPAAAEVIKQAHQVGVQMDFFLVTHAPGPPENELHREALIQAARRLSDDGDVDTDRVALDRISIDRFYGSGYERATGRVLLWDTYGMFTRGTWVPEFMIPVGERLEHPDTWGPFRWADDPDPDPMHAVYIPKDLWLPGFANAFLHQPPWLQLNLTPRQAHGLFRSFDELVLKLPPTDTPVSYSKADPWNPWAPCFAGMGAFSCAWVLRQSESHLLVIVAASDHDP